jgi:hypothetical protein
MGEAKRRKEALGDEYGKPQVRAPLALLCDAANHTPEGKLNICGEFNNINAPQLPVQWASMTLVVRLECSIAAGTEHSLRIDMVNDDGQEIVPRSPEIHAKFLPTGPGRPLRAQMITAMEGLIFKEYGDYEFRIFVDGKLTATVPIYITQPQQVPPALHGQG